MGERPQHLRIVPFNPNDYGLAEVLMHENATVVVEPSTVASALSLCFQYPECTRTLVYLDARNPEFEECSMFRDEDERDLTELRIRLRCGEGPPLPLEGKAVRIRFEIFRTCYECTVRVLWRSDSRTTSDEWHIVTDAPEQLSVFKNRRMPRVKLPIEAVPEQLRDVFWESDGKKTRVTLAELSMASVLIVSPDPLASGSGVVSIGEEDFPGNLHLRGDRCASVQLLFENGRQAGRYFDLFRLVAFPFLRPRGDYPHDQMLKLYKQTGYLTNFLQGVDEGEYFDKVKSVWHNLTDAFHDSLADYAVLDDAGMPVGVSGVARAFSHHDADVWVFHQLCSAASPDLLERSGLLYTWRSLYLASRPEACHAIVWFRSRGRWIERIYTKFANISHSPVTLRPVVLQVARFARATTDPASIPSKTLKMGTCERAHVEAGATFGGAEPLELNMSGSLNHIIVGGDVERREIQPLAQSLMRALGKDEITLYLTQEPDAPKPPEMISQAASDRYCRFSKESMIDFISSVEHSVALTKRKLEHGRIVA